MDVQVVVSMVIIGSRGLRVDGIGVASGGRRQEVDLVFGGTSHDLLRIGEIVDALEQLFQRPRRCDPE
jgi:hypothetical protein